MRYWLVMPAAGVGRRFGNTKPKQYAPLQGRTVIEWALAPFLADPSCAGVSISLAADDPYWGEVADCLAKLAGHVPEIIFAGGGVERSHSVRKGLAALGTRAAADDWVLVHDAARPCLSSDDLQHLLNRLGSHRVGGILATPAADTLKRASTELRASVDLHSSAVPRPGVDPRPSSGPRGTPVADPEVAQTVDRAGLWRALTPQMFRYELL